MRLTGTRGWILVEDIYERFAQKLAYNMLKILSTQNHTDFETLHGILFFAICFDKHCTSCQSFEVRNKRNHRRSNVNSAENCSTVSRPLCAPKYYAKNLFFTNFLPYFEVRVNFKNRNGGLLLWPVMHGSSATMFSKQKICLQRSEQKGYMVKIFSAIVIWQSGKIAPWTDLVCKVYRQDLMTRRNWVHYYPSLSSIGE